MSVGLKTSSIPVIELTVVPPSLIESAAICEWQSMMPGDTNLPVASTMSAPLGIAAFAPTSVILPLRRTMVPFSIVPRVTVRMVAPLIATTDSGDCVWVRSGSTTAASVIRNRMRRDTVASSDVISRSLADGQLFETGTGRTIPGCAPSSPGGSWVCSAHGRCRRSLYR